MPGAEHGTDLRRIGPCFRPDHGRHDRLRQFDVSFTDSSEAPIYAGLVEEHGDVPAEVRRVAEETMREADRAIDFSDVRRSAAYR